MKKTSIIFLGIFVLTNISFVFGQYGSRQSGHLSKMTIKVNSLKRLFYLYVPKNLPKNQKYPLVFVFHGGRGNARRTDRTLKFSQLASKEKFIVVYPESVGGNWNDGRKSERIRSQRENIDDIGFVNAIINSVSKKFKIDEKRIFSTGASNGGIFSHYLGAKLSDKFAAIAPVIGGIAEPLSKDFNPEKPVSVFIIQGTKDRLVPFNGGNVARNRGRVISTERTIDLWKRHNKVNTEAKKGRLPDIDKTDGCTVETFLWTEGKNDTVVKFYKLHGGGHTWTNTKSYLPKWIVGNTCRDFDATIEIWEFFKKHPRK